MSEYIESFDDIMKQDDLPCEELPIPEWSGKVVRLRSLTAAERDEFEASQMRINKKGQPEADMANLRARLCAMVLVKSDGTKLLTNRKMTEFLGGKSAKALERIFVKAREMNGLDDDEPEKIAEDFSGAPDGDSSSD